MSAPTCAIASDDDVDTASARTGKKDHVRSDRMDSDANAADAQNIEDKKQIFSIFFFDSLMQMQGSKPECASGHTHVRSDAHEWRS